MPSFYSTIHAAILAGTIISSSVCGLSTISQPRPAGTSAGGLNTNTNTNTNNNFDISHAVNEFFNVVGSVRSTKVFEAPVTQDGIKLYIATDGEFCINRPGNGGIRLLDYQTDDHAIDDAIRLAEGMTRKHDMFRTGFSGAKLVANTNVPIDTIERKSLMEDIAKALEGTYKRRKIYYDNY
jgi:hypothetical protein